MEEEREREQISCVSGIALFFASVRRNEHTFSHRSHVVVKLYLNQSYNIINFAACTSRNRALLVIDSGYACKLRLYLSS